MMWSWNKHLANHINDDFLRSIGMASVFLLITCSFLPGQLCIYLPFKSKTPEVFVTFTFNIFKTGFLISMVRWNTWSMLSLQSLNHPWLRTSALSSPSAQCRKTWRLASDATTQSYARAVRYVALPMDRESPPDTGKMAMEKNLSFQ